MLNHLPDFNRLKIFFYIYTYQSITIASGHANVSPSAVSQQLKKLEEEIGQQLFSRPHKRMVPTAAGTDLFEVISPFVNSLKNLVLTMKSAKDRPSGLLKIGAPVEFGKVVMPKVIAGFRKMFEEVTFRLVIGRTSELLPLVQKGELDFAFVDTFPVKEQLSGEWGGISVQPVFDEVVVLACSAEYEKRHLDGNYSYANMRKQQFVAQQQDARAIRKWFYYNYRKSIQELNVVLTVANHQAVVNAIQCDLGLGIIVAQLVENEVSAGSIRPIETGKKNPVNQVSLIQLMDKIPSLTERSFQKYILQVLGDGARSLTS